MPSAQRAPLLSLSAGLLVISLCCASGQQIIWNSLPLVTPQQERTQLAQAAARIEAGLAADRASVESSIADDGGSSSRGSSSMVSAEGSRDASAEAEESDRQTTMGGDGLAGLTTGSQLAAALQGYYDSIVEQGSNAGLLAAALPVIIAPAVRNVKASVGERVQGQQPTVNETSIIAGLAQMTSSIINTISGVQSNTINSSADLAQSVGIEPAGPAAAQANYLASTTSKLVLRGFGLPHSALGGAPEGAEVEGSSQGLDRPDPDRKGELHQLAFSG